MADDSDHSSSVWQVHIPQWGFSFPSIFHLLLALSALHLGSQQPERREQSKLEATGHFNSGIQSVNSILPQLDSELCQIVYLSAVMICFVYFGQGPQPGEYLVFSDSGRSEFLVLMRGVKSILSSKQEQIFTGVLTPRGEDRPEVVSEPLKLELSEHLARLDGIRQIFQIQEVDLERQLYTPAINNLSSIFEEVYKARTLGKDGVTLMPLVIGWIYCLKNPFIGLLEAKDPSALVILAYWCILLKYMGTSWLMAGWDKHVLSGVLTSLKEDDYQWIAWPVKVIHES